MPSIQERRELAKQFATDVARMQRCVRDVGKQVADDDIVYAWTDYSDSFCASWLMLPEDDATLLKILLKHLPLSLLAGRVVIQDTGDGSGDQVLVLPAELFEQMGWKEGDTLSITKSEDEGLVLRRVD